MRNIDRLLILDVEFRSNNCLIFLSQTTFLTEKMIYVSLYVLVVHHSNSKNRFFQKFQLCCSVEYCTQTYLSLVEFRVKLFILLALIYFIHISLHCCFLLSVFAFFIFLLVQLIGLKKLFWKFSYRF